MKGGLYVAVAVVGLAAAAPAMAHHAHAMYATDTEIVLEGTVKEMRWMNPHSWMYIVVPGAKGAQPKTWAFEGAATGQLVRKGWTRDSVKPGDKIKIACWPLRNGSEGCLGGYVLEVNGTALPPSQEKHAGREFD